MQVKRFYVEKLFGLFDHSIELKTARATIMHAPNGLGKTMLLRLLHALFTGNLSPFATIPFKSFGTELVDGRIIKVQIKADTPTKKSHGKRAEKSVEFILGDEKWVWPNDRQERAFSVMRRVERDLPELSQIGPDLWRTPEGGLVQLEDLVNMYPNLALDRSLEGMPAWLAELRKSIPTRLIRTERLVLPELDGSVRRPPADGLFRPTVSRFSDELQMQIRLRLAEYGAVSQSLDQSFPQRLVRTTVDSWMPSDELVRRLTALNERRNQLAETGLLDLDREQPLPIQEQIDDDKRGVLSVYVSDSEDKLKVLDDLRNRLELLIDAVRRRFRHKTFAISRGEGFVFTADSGQQLRATDLSSGEQHELILLYELLFKVPQGSLLLIDEPEISLHVAWQISFLDDVLKMAEAADIHVLIATHSPQIINNRWDLTVELKDVSR